MDNFLGRRIAIFPFSRNNYMYIYKDNLIKIDLQSGKQETIISDIYKQTNADWLDLNYVHKDTYFFSVVDNGRINDGINHSAYYYYNKKDGFVCVMKGGLPFGAKSEYSEFYYKETKLTPSGIYYYSHDKEYQNHFLNFSTMKMEKIKG